MATTAELLGPSGPGNASITIDGVSYTLTRSTKKIQAEWSKWLTDRAEERAFHTADKYRARAAKAVVEAQKLAANFDDPTRTAQDNVREEELTLQARMLQAEASKIVERFNDRVASGEFEYYGNVALEHAQQGLPGQIMLIYLCLIPKHPAITLEEVERLHMPDSRGQNHIAEWREALLRSEGVLIKKPVPPTSEADTPTAAT